jgi:hypothetical protein
MNNYPQLTEKDIDDSIFYKQKPGILRPAMDNFIIPAGGMALGGTMRALQALSSIKREPKMLYQVK